MSIATRPLGKTGVNVSMLCIGGWHIGQPAISDAESVRLLQTAMDEGITFFDNAWDYHMGRSEELMGAVLAEGGRRAKAFLMTKNCGRDAETSRQHLEDSLRRLKTDCIDLWQFHEINYDNDPEWILERGALAFALQAQKEGKIRFIGYTGHKSPQILAKMLPLYDWDTCELPINVCDHFYRSFEKELLPELIRRGIGPIGIKSLGGGNLEQGGVFVRHNVCTPRDAIRYALSRPISSLVVGIDTMDILKQDVEIAKTFTPLVGEELEALLARVKPVAGDGRYEYFKSTQAYDGPYHREQHGFAA